MKISINSSTAVTTEFKNTVVTALSDSIISVSFTKKDGTGRVLKCTTSPKYIPESLLPKTANSKPKTNSVMNVYDTESGSWKSFKWDSVNEVAMS